MATATGCGGKGDVLLGPGTVKEYPDGSKTVELGQGGVYATGEGSIGLSKPRASAEVKTENWSGKAEMQLK
jgi:hypothetical protein